MNMETVQEGNEYYYKEGDARVKVLVLEVNEDRGTAKVEALHDAPEMGLSEGETGYPDTGRLHRTKE